uniref:Integrase catalytic domain-containing protein n=1 Tax=Fagus sylvatica TaxID=28930 RepID=A0A2N9EWA5_FAGSY
MAPGSRGVGAVFVHFSGEDSGQTGDAIGEPRVPRRSWSHYLSNAPGLADQLVASRKDSAREGGCSRFAGIRAWTCEIWFREQRSTGVFLVRLRTVFRSGFRLRPGKILAIREFHVVHECVFFPTCPGLWINLLRVRKTLRASVATSVGKFRKFQHSLISSACFHARGRRSSRCRILTILVSSESLRYLLFNGTGLAQRRAWELLTIRKLRAVAEVNLLPKGLGSWTKLQRVGENLHAQTFDHNSLVSRPFLTRKVSRIEALICAPRIGQGVVSSIQLLVWSTVRSNLQRTPVGSETVWSNLGQTRSTLVKLREMCLESSSWESFDVASPRRIRPARFGLSRFACRHPRKSRGQSEIRMDENQRKEDDKDTSEAEPEGHSNTNATPPRPPTPPKPEGKDSQLDSKIDSLEEKIRLIQGLNSFGNTDFFEHVLVPQHDGATQVQGPGVREIQWERRPHDPSANLRIRFDLQRMEKKSNETFREYAQRWREKAARARPPLDEREMIKIFVDTLKNPYFDRMMGLQMQFFVDLIPPNKAAKKAPTKRKEGDVQMIGRNNGRPRQVLPTFTMQPIQPRPIQAPAPTQAPAPAPGTSDAGKAGMGNQPNDNRPYNGPQRRDFNPNSTCDFHFGEVGHTVENCGQLRHRVQDLIDHGVLKFEGLPNITTNPLPKHPEGGVNMVEIEEGNEERIAWRRLFYTLEKQRHITPLDAPPGPSTGDCINGLGGERRNTIRKRSRQPDDPSEFDWYAEINLDDIVEDEMDLDNLQDEADWGYFMEDDTDEWRDVDFSDRILPIPVYLIVPPGFVTPEFEIFYEDGDPEVHLQKYGEKMALHLENELLMISVFPESLSKQTAAWFYQLRNLTGWDDLVRVFLGAISLQSPFDSRILGRIQACLSLPALTEGEEEEKDQAMPPAKDPATPPKDLKTPPSNITTTTAEEEDAGPMVEGFEHPHHCRGGGFHHHTTDPPLPTGRRSQDVDLRTIATACLEITRKTSNDPHVSKIDNKTDCSLDNIDNSDEEIELPSDILEALERQDEGSKPNIEELEIVNLGNEGEEPREVKIGTRCAAEQKEALIALMQARQTSTATDEARSHFEDQGRGGKAIEGRFPKHSNLFGLGSQYSPGAEERTEKSESTNVVFSFMDGFSGYNQIKMAEEDKSKTAFVTHWGTFVYDVMPFGLKNAGATYQRAMVTLFHDMIHHEIEKYQLRLNPNKCAFGVTSGKLLGFIVSGRGIEIDPAKLTATCEPLFKLLRKDVKIKWTEDCQKAFDKIKEYLLNPPILVPPTPGRPLILYLTVQEASMGCMLGQQDETGKKEQAIYYLSKKFTEPETRYLLVEKTCCALAWASKKLRQYMLYYTTWLVSRMDPIKYIFEKPALTGKIARWQVLLSEFDILFVARKAIKGQAIADYLADYPSEQLELMDSEFPDEDVMIVEEDNQGRWKLYFDGAANAVGSGIGAVLVSPKGQQTPIAVKLGFDCTNNMTEYEACIVGLQAALGIRRLIPKFKYVTFTYTPRAHNHFADALATLASLIKLVEGDDVRPLRIETRDIPAYCVCIEECMNVEAEIDDKPWYYDIKRFIQDREYPSRATENEKKYIRRMAFQFFLSGEILAIDYFTKWVGGMFLQECHSSRSHPVCEEQHHLPLRNARNAHHRQCFQPKQPHDGSSLCQQFKIQHHNSAPYRPKMNGAVEAANKNVKKILSKMTETYKDWHEHLPYALCAYRTSVRTSVGATPYSLVYGMEAVLPVEVEIPSLRILSQTQLEEAEWAQARYEQLNFIDEKKIGGTVPRTALPETDRKSLQQEGSTSHFPTRRSRSEEEEYGPIRSTRKVRTII